LNPLFRPINTSRNANLYQFGRHVLRTQAFGLSRWLAISRRYALYLTHSAEGIDDSAASKQFAATTKRVTKGMPKQPEKLWAWLTGRDQKILLAILAVCAAATVDTVEKRRGVTERDPDTAHAGQLAAALKLDMARYWQPTAASYFARVPKERTLDAIEDACGLSEKSLCAAMKKSDLAAHAEKKLTGKGWLPAILR
jgi:ParB family transcriptional regulator, chromosome partitioning protein